MNKMPREKLLVVMAAVCLAVLLGDRLVLGPLAGFWKDRAQRITELKKQTSHGDALLARADHLRSRWLEMQAQSLDRDVSEAENDVLKSVARWARESGISFTSLKPQWKEPEKNHQLLVCRATGFGRMEEIVRFLFELETDPLPLKVEELELSARDDRGSQLTLNVRFSGLLLKEEENR